MEKSLPLYVVIGTRGQFVKTAPVLKMMQERGIPFKLINTGQHTVSSIEIAKIFGIRAGDEFVTQRKKDIEKISEAWWWFLKAFFRLVFRRKKFFERAKGLVVIHGDTLSTLLGLLVARLLGMEVAHIESGLRSHSWVHPFPEEIIRILACRYSHQLFAPSEAAFENLKNHRAQKYNTRGNTVFDAIAQVESFAPQKEFFFPYCVATIHPQDRPFGSLSGG